MKTFNFNEQHLKFFHGVMPFHSPFLKNIIMYMVIAVY